MADEMKQTDESMDGQDTEAPEAGEPHSRGGSRGDSRAGRDELGDDRTIGGEPDETADDLTQEGEAGEEIEPVASELASELEAQRDRYLRLAAEFDNYRRRTTRERGESTARAQAALAKELIETLDDLARFSALDPATTDATTVIEGVTMVDRKMLKVLGAAGLEIVDPIDQPFDPAVHEAVATEPAASEEQDSTVSRVYQPGYVFAGQLLRPARVVVRQWNG